MSDVIRIVVADDQPLVRSGLITILGGQPDLDVVGEANNGAEALRVCEETQPNVVLMDIRMPVLDGLEATRRLLAPDRSQPPWKVLVLTTFDLDEYAYEALRAGASGFLLKDASPEFLTQAVRACMGGHVLVAPEVTTRLVEQWHHPLRREASAALSRLTSRERDVLQLVARGLANAEIGQLLRIEETTVKTHVSRLLAKLSARDRVQLVISPMNHASCARPDAVSRRLPRSLTAARPVQLCPPGEAVTVYLAIVLPPLLAGAVHDTVACRSPRVAETPVGAPGGVGAGVTVFDAVGAELSPIALLATARKEYHVPLLSPVTVQDTAP